MRYSKGSCEDYSREAMSSSNAQSYTFFPWISGLTMAYGQPLRYLIVQVAVRSRSVAFLIVIVWSRFFFGVQILADDERRMRVSRRTWKRRVVLTRFTSHGKDPMTEFGDSSNGWNGFPVTWMADDEPQYCMSLAWYSDCRSVSPHWWQFYVKAAVSGVLIYIIW